jgi:hypothetical protein
MSQNEIDAATQIRAEEVNTQMQTRIVWQPTSAVAKAYVDQLTRTKSIQADRARAVRDTLEKADAVRGGSDKNAAVVASQLDTLAASLEADAAAATGRDAARLRSLAETIKGRAQRLR